MSIVLPLAHSVQSYLRRFGQFGPNLPLFCPHCTAQRMHKHGRYFRAVVCRWRVFQIPIYRWRCPQCKKTLTVLPDFLKPYARFLALLREKAVWRRLAGWSWERIARAVSSPAVSIVSVRTLLRWFKRAGDWVSDRGTEPLGRLVTLAPGLEIHGLAAADTSPVALLTFLRQTGQHLYSHVGRPKPGHPGLYALLNRLLGGRPYL